MQPQQHFLGIKGLDESISANGDDNSLDSFNVTRTADGAAEETKQNKSSSVHRPVPKLKSKASVPSKQHSTINLPDLAPKKHVKRVIENSTSCNTTPGPTAPTDNKFIPAQGIAPRRKQTQPPNRLNLRADGKNSGEKTRVSKTTKGPEECREIKMSFSKPKPRKDAELSQSVVTPLHGERDDDVSS